MALGLTACRRRAVICLWHPFFHANACCKNGETATLFYAGTGCTDKQDYVDRAEEALDFGSIDEEDIKAAARRPKGTMRISTRPPIPP